MRCTKCGTEGVSGQKFCAECGSPLSNRCANCNSDNAPEAKFCVECGTRLNPAADMPVSAGTASGASAARNRDSAATVSNSGSNPNTTVSVSTPNGPSAATVPGSGSNPNGTFSAGAPSAPATASSRDSVAAVQTPEAIGERRHLTVLFADLVGSTAIAARLDPEEWRATVSEYHRVAANAITLLWRTRREIPRRRGDGVVRLAGSARQRCGAGGAGGAGDYRRPGEARRGDTSQEMI